MNNAVQQLVSITLSANGVNQKKKEVYQLAYAEAEKGFSTVSVTLNDTDWSERKTKQLIRALEKDGFVAGFTQENYKDKLLVSWIQI